MRHCKDCIHYGVCIFHITGDECKKCPHFKTEPAISPKREQIVKALRCCTAHRYKDEDCDSCPYNKRWETTGCVNELIEDMLKYLENGDT